MQSDVFCETGGSFFRESQRDLPDGLKNMIGLRRVVKGLLAFRNKRFENEHCRKQLDSTFYVRLQILPERLMKILLTFSKKKAGMY